MFKTNPINKLFKATVFLAIAFVLVPQAHAQGIRFGGDDDQGSLRSQPRMEEEQNNQSQRLGGTPSKADEAGQDLLIEAQKMRARYRQKKAEASGTAGEHRYGFIVAFFDSESLLDPTLVKGLNRLESMDGIKFALFNSQNKLDRPITERSQAELRRLEGLEPPMARDDTGGHIAKQYNVTKFPTILYETPDHDVIPFYVPNTLEKVFTRIGYEQRKQARR